MCRLLLCACMRLVTRTLSFIMRYHAVFFTDWRSSRNRVSHSIADDWFTTVHPFSCPPTHARARVSTRGFIAHPIPAFAITWFLLFSRVRRPFDDKRIWNIQKRQISDYVRPSPISEQNSERLPALFYIILLSLPLHARAHAHYCCGALEYIKSL